MKKTAVSILIFLFLGNTVLFSQDGEEIDFLEKVAEPKKTANKKSSSSSSSTKSSKKKEKKKFKKKKSKKSSHAPINPENSKKSVEPSYNGEESSNSGNNSQNNASNSNSSNSSNPNPQGNESQNVNEQQLASVSKMNLSNLPKPYWINEEVKVRPNNLPGYTASAEPSKVEQGPSFQNRLSDILKLGEDKKKEEEKKKVQEGQKSGSFTGFISENKKIIIIAVIILLFALYRFKAGKSRGSSNRRSPVTINKMRRD